MGGARFLSPLRGSACFFIGVQARRAPLRFALAPGYLITRLWRWEQKNARVPRDSRQVFQHQFVVFAI